ncbi:S8 family serine peptidase [Deinococcus sp. MIMF12]|uniref:S8 family serine peptidase n=1 Tax=Deinococcus rhizophilus TaxID=3049544 RepID=A0ABT7JD59_9DEIO|nr:S8 family serine peptidase [Deinococcus rhizophilus]MDL2342989.1 S8 family serine peptidase [Deinococcus rhizophilus]
MLQAQTSRLARDLWLVHTPAGMADQAFAHRLAREGVHVQPDFLYHALEVRPNDPGFPGNGGMSGGPNETQTYLTRIGFPEAWTALDACGKTPRGAPTAVLDTGVDADHPDLAGRLKATVDLTGQNSPDTDTYGHGTTSVGLIAAATNNRLGLAGITWEGQTALSVRVFDRQGSASTSTLVQALQYATQQGARVINLSLGLPEDPGDAALDAALAEAGRTAVLVAAAGNTNGTGVYYPASHPAVLAVGAVGPDPGALACYSARPTAQFPRALDLVAPGGAGSTLCAGTSASDDLLVLVPGGYARRAGTSLAAPLVSGVASLMRAANPGLSASQTRALLVESADRSGGLPMLDAEAAVRAALGQ